MFRSIRRFLVRLTEPLREWLGRIPLLAYLAGLVVAVLIERQWGDAFANLLGFRKIPAFFGIGDLLEPFSEINTALSGILGPFFPTPSQTIQAPLQQSGEAVGSVLTTFVNALFYQGRREPGFFDTLLRVTIYDVVIFVIPILVIALLLRGVSRQTVTRLPHWANGVVHLALLYLALALWGNLNDYRALVLVYMGVNIMLTISLNLVNGYMGEFSVGHAGFMAVGAYVSSVLTMWAFTDSRVFGPHVLPPELGLPFGFIIALIAGGVAAALAGLLVAFPSFKTRGDYLAIVTLAVNFIVQGVINNMEFIGGPRGLNGVPLWSNMHWVFALTLLSVLGVYLLVNSTFGKGIVAIREDEVAAGLMGVNTRRVKLVAFLISSFIAGVAGGLLAHTLAYVNPGMFGILRSTEVLAMVYLGGMGSISGSIIAAVLFTLLIEALRPLEVLKWVVIPLILIFVMLYRPQGLFGFREIKLNLGAERAPRARRHPPTAPTEVSDAASGN